jgi:hypothetical protein
MLGEHGGLQTAKMLLNSSAVSDGFTALWEADRLDLTVEYQVLQPDFAALFTSEELETARRRLREYGLAEDGFPGREAHLMPRETASRERRRAVGGSDAYRATVRLMDTFARDRGLTIVDTDASRKYRHGKKGPSAWIQSRQGKIYFDLRPLRRADAGDSAEQLRSALQALTASDVKSDMAAIPLADAVAQWDALLTGVIEPFFLGTETETAIASTRVAAMRGAIEKTADTAPTPVARPYDASDSDAEEVLLEISRRRNAIETRLRVVLAQGLRYEYGQKAAAALISCLAENRRTTLVGRSYQDMWQALFFKELRDVVNKEWSAFSGWFSDDKDKVLTWLEHVNRSRADAHAKPISEEDLAYLRVCFKRLEEALDL